MAYHAFVAMPFRVNDNIDFNRVYSDLIQPALESAGFKVFRADEEMRAVIGIRCRREKMPFDVYTDRSLKYHIKESPPDNFHPDPAHIAEDKAALAKFATETLASWYDRKVSPVYHLLPFLKEPNWTSLRMAEACLARDMRVELRLAFDEPTFLQRSIAFASDRWVERDYEVKARPKTAVLIMPNELGPVLTGVSAFSRTNIWQLYTALAWGTEKVRFVCLWNCQGGDGPGGTEHMHDTVKRYSGRVCVRDTTKLW